MVPADNLGEQEDARSELDGVPEEFGLRIATARKARGMTAAEMAHQLNLTATALRHIESGQWSQIGPLVYIRGYIRACARELSISDSDTDAWFRAQEVRDSGKERADIFAPIRPSKLQQPNRMLGYVAATALLAVPAVWLVMRAFDSGLTQSPVVQQDAEPMREARQASIAVLPPRPGTNETATQDDPAIDTNASHKGTKTTILVSVPQENPPASAVVPESIAPETMLTLRFSEQAWLEARTLDGERLAYGLVAGGAERVLPMDRGLQVRLGNADAVSVTLGEDSFDLAAYVTNDLAEFRLDPQ